MLSYDTVLVLGAGASKPYGFPSGPELVQSIVRTCAELRAKDMMLRHMLSELRIGWNEIAQFATELELSGMYSIDAFLQDREEYLPIGKLMIASQLIPLENPRSFGGEISGDWYRYLFNRICEIRSSDRKGNLAILTFNYERSLEFFLLRSFKAKFGCEDKEAIRRLNEIQFIYLHGNLGDLPIPGGPGGRPYDAALTAEILQCAANSLKIIHEKVDEERFMIARNLLQNAQRVCFMGLSYHALNIRRLIGKNAFQNALGQVYGTSFGLMAGECQLATNLFPKRIQLKPVTCLDMLREVPIIF